MGRDELDAALARGCDGPATGTLLASMGGCCACCLAGVDREGLRERCAADARGGGGGGAAAVEPGLALALALALGRDGIACAVPVDLVCLCPCPCARECWDARWSTNEGGGGRPCSTRLDARKLLCVDAAVALAGWSCARACASECGIETATHCDWSGCDEDDESGTSWCASAVAAGLGKKSDEIGRIHSP